MPARLRRLLQGGDTRLLVAVLAVAFLIRVGAVIATDDYRPLFDSLDYARHAQSIATGHGYPETLLGAEGGPTAFRPPVYPYLLGAVYAVTGESLTAGRLAAAFASTVAVLLLYLVALELWDRRVALGGAAIAAAFPPLALWHTALLSEPVFLVIELAAVLTALVGRRSPRVVAWGFVAGLLCGLAGLTRSNGLLLVVPLAAGLWIARPRLSRSALAAPAAVCLGAILVVAPWTVRNTLAFDRVVPTSTQAGYGVAGTYNDTTRTERLRGTFHAPQFQGPHQPLFRRPGLDEAELDAELRRRGIDYALSHPGYVAEATGLNALRMLALIETRSEASLESGGSTLPSTVIDVAELADHAVIVLALLGAALLTAKRSALRWGPKFVWMVPLILTLPALPIAGGLRYRVPADPFLVMLAAIAVVGAWRIARRSTAERPDDRPTLVAAR